MAAPPPQQFCVRWNSYHANLQTWFPRLLLSEQFADVTLACESRQLRCHKLVLSACSAYLERLLAANPCTHPIVLCRDMRFSEMQALVDFMYKGEVNVTQEELPGLLRSAEALQIRGLCSSETASAAGMGSGSGGEGESRVVCPDFGEASDALLAATRGDRAALNGPSKPPPPLASTAASPANKQEMNVNVNVKEETVEEDGLYYGELDHDHMEYNEDEEPGKPGSSIGQTSANLLRVKPESELFFQTKLQKLAKANSEYLTKLSDMNPDQIRSEFSKYGLGTCLEDQQRRLDHSERDYYKSWLEQNGELEVSLLRATRGATRGARGGGAAAARSEVELIPKPREGARPKETGAPPGAGDKCRRRGRPPIFKDKDVDIGESLLKSDLEQFLEGKEVSSSGLSRKDLERVMMGKFNPNRRYSNEAMWAALMDVKKGGSIYRAAQTHKVPRKSLRNWMKRCHIKSSFPMPQQLKQFVENSKKQKEYKDFPETFEKEEIQFGNHFLFNSNVSSDDSGRNEEGSKPEESNRGENEISPGDPESVLDMSLHE